jgi:dipeptide/tripeptide permease
MSAIFPFYFTEGLSEAHRFSDSTSTIFTNLWMGLCALFSILSGWLSDRVTGNYPLQLGGLIGWCVGAAMIFLSVWRGLVGSDPRLVLPLAFVGVFTQAAGYGIADPLQSVFVADQFEEGQEEDMTR